MFISIKLIVITTISQPLKCQSKCGFTGLDLKLNPIVKYYKSTVESIDSSSSSLGSLSYKVIYKH